MIDFKDSLIIHQNEDGSLQLRDSISRFWCACGKAAVEYKPDNDHVYKFRCNKCLAKERSDGNS